MGCAISLRVTASSGEKNKEMSTVVLSLVRTTNTDTIQLFESLSNEARRDEITDACIAYRTRSGRLDVAFSGRYRRDPAQAVHAAMTLVLRLAQHEDT
jgi:hypothetical protein